MHLLNRCEQAGKVAHGRVFPALALIMTVFLLMALPANSSATDLENLTRGFSQAFADPVQFRNTRLFDILGYTPDQVKQMVEVTPRPATLTVEYRGMPGPDGHFNSIRVTAHEVKYYNLTIDHAVFDFPSVQLNMEKLNQGILEFKKAATVGIETYVSEGDILRVFDLVAKARNLSQLKMDISEKQTILRGKTKKGIFLVAFEVYGVPFLQGAKAIHFDCRKLVLNGLSLPQSAIKAVFNSINPVFDARKTWLNLDFQRIVLEKGFVRSQGTIHSVVPASPIPLATPVSPQG